MTKINQLDDIFSVAGKRTLLRVDFNVPINDGSISETSRIEKILPTIRYLINKKAKVIIISHLGRPKGKIVPELTLKPISKKLSEYLNQNVLFLSESIGKNVIKKTKEISNGQVLLLENVRFYKEEELNTEAFAKELSKLGDVYINEAFSCSHRAHSSVCEVAKYMDSFAGRQLMNELKVIEMITGDAKKPVACIIGGSKISTKIGVITNLAKKMQNIIIVGAMANNFIKYKGYNVGKSLFEKNQKDLVESIIQNCKINDCNLVLPQDVVVSNNPESKGKLKNLNEINDEDIILDIGKKTIENILKIIDGSKTLLWNGPAGYFESEEFSVGSRKITKKISENTKRKSLISVAGGGDTAAAINKFGYTNSFTYISTAGGAFLEFLEGKKLPGIEALKN